MSLCAGDIYVIACHYAVTAAMICVTLVNTQADARAPQGGEKLFWA